MPDPGCNFSLAAYGVSTKDRGRLQRKKKRTTSGKEHIELFLHKKELTSGVDHPGEKLRARQVDAAPGGYCFARHSEALRRRKLIRMV